MFRCRTFAIFALLIFSARAPAQVYEIADNGALNVREGGGAVTWRDARAVPAPAILQALTPVLSATAPNNLTDALHQSAARHAISPALLEAVVWQESRWHAGAISPKGAIGLTQLMPATALALGVNPHDPIANLDAGARYLRMMLDRFGGNLENALAAYNAGPARVQRAGGIPAIRETQNYVAAIMARLGNRIIKP
jgi:soluble lytic murein transglycosylase-like protein